MSTTSTAPINFAGTVSAEAEAGETVTVQITNPDGSVGLTATGLTVDDGLGAATSITYKTSPDIQVPVATGYSAVASIAADTADQAATSTPKTFDVTASLRARTITLDAVTEPAA
jgi:hypothetical protein